MARNVYKAQEIQFTETKVHISPPVLSGSRKVQEFNPSPIEELDDLPDMPVITGPSPEEIERETNQFRERLDAERDQLLTDAKEEAERVVKQAEQVAFDEIQRKGAQAQELKSKAEAEASQTLARAEAKARELIEAAERRVTEIEKDAYQRGLDNGKEEGYQVGKAEADRLVDRLHLILSRAIERRNQILTESETQLVGLVLNIAKKVVKVLTENQRNVVINNVLQALRKLKSKSDVVIRVNIIDLKVTTDHIKEIVARIERVQNVSVLEDATVDPGGCIIETDFGEIDARISSQLNEIEDKIVEVAPIRTRVKETGNQNASL